MISSVTGNRRTRGYRGSQQTELDGQIATDATKAIDWVTTVPADRIRLTVRRGCIHLGGAVNSWHEKQVVEEVVRPLEGVRKVVNAITIDPCHTLVL